jgi:hypothetical protein
MTEFKVSPATEDGKPSTLKVPLALIGPVWGIIAAVCGLWLTMYNTQRDQGQAIALMSKDVSTLKTSLANVDRTVSVYNDSAYTVADASRDNGAIKSELADHEARLRAIEKRRR